MSVVETIAKIRRLHFGQGKPIKVICRELGLSRKVVRKVIRSGASAFHYEREHQPLPKIGPWRERLDGLLATNESKSSREQLTLMRIYEDLRGAGYDGSYDALRISKSLRASLSGRDLTWHKQGVPFPRRYGVPFECRLTPDDRYFSIPSMEVGADVRMKRALNCWPWL